MATGRWRNRIVRRCLSGNIERLCQLSRL
jgi:hypothetical protein